MSYGQHNAYSAPSGYGHPGGYPSPGGYGGPQGHPYGANTQGHGWGQQHGPQNHEFEAMLHSDAFANAVMRVCGERMEAVLASQGYFPAGMQGSAGYGDYAPQYDMGKHRRFKEVMEEIREAPSSDAARLIEARFANISPEERKLLMVLANECSKSKLASKAGIPLERFMELKHGLEHKLK